MDVTFFGVPLNPLTVVKGKIIMTQVKIVRKTLFKSIAIGANSTAIRKKDFLKSN